MSDDRISTVLDTTKDTLTFQEYFVRERHQVEVKAVRFEGADRAHPAPGVIESIAAAEAIVFAPSNPVTSIGPILAVPGIRDALRRTETPVVAVSPIVGGKAVSGPASALMKMMGWQSTIAGVAKVYEDFLDVLIADRADEAEASTMSGRPRVVLHEHHHEFAGREARTGTIHARSPPRPARSQTVTMRGILLIPVKTLSTAKQRLAEALNQSQRSQLAEAMLRDVMTAASGVRSRIDLALVTGDARAQQLAREFGFGVIEDTRNESETVAIEMATAWCEEQGFDTTVVVPGDIPLITSDEVHRVLDAAPAEGAVFVPAYDRRGSNCILRRPASLIPSALRQ